MGTETTATPKRKNGRNGHVRVRLMSLRGDLDALQQDMRGLANDVGDAASEQVQGAVNGAIESAAEAADGVRQAVRTQPLAACALSMSAGAIIGALLLR